MNEDYSQAGQDKFVNYLINDTNEHYFVDIGCWHPKTLNNTLLLEENGWRGISIDITDLSNEWKSRNTPFYLGNALTIDYSELLQKYNIPMVVDYLNVDIEGDGGRFSALKKVFESKREFKVITIEHDIYRGYEETETIPQRNFLISQGYVLVCSNVCLSNNPFDDWWINPKYIDEKKYKHLICNNLEFSEILKKL